MIANMPFDTASVGSTTYLYANGYPETAYVVTSWAVEPLPPRPRGDTRRFRADWLPPPVPLELATLPMPELQLEPRVPTARRSGCRSRGRRPLRSRPGRRNKRDGGTT